MLGPPKPARQAIAETGLLRQVLRHAEQAGIPAHLCFPLCAASPLGDPGGQPGDHGGPVAGSEWVAGPPQRAGVLPAAARCEGPGGGAWPGPGGAAGALTPGERRGLGSRSPGRWGEDASGPRRRARQEARVDRPGVSQLPSPGGSARLPFASWHLALASASQRAVCPSHRASSAPSSQRLPDCGCRLASTARPGHWLRHHRRVGIGVCGVEPDSIRVPLPNSPFRED